MALRKNFSSWLGNGLPKSCACCCGNETCLRCQATTDNNVITTQLGHEQRIFGERKIDCEMNIKYQKRWFQQLALPPRVWGMTHSDCFIRVAMQGVAPQNPRHKLTLSGENGGKWRNKNNWGTITASKGNCSRQGGMIYTCVPVTTQGAVLHGRSIIS